MVETVGSPAGRKKSAQSCCDYIMPVARRLFVDFDDFPQLRLRLAVAGFLDDRTVAVDIDHQPARFAAQPALGAGSFPAPSLVVVSFGVAVWFVAVLDDDAPFVR